jgi:hypothetical protein
MLPLAWIHRPRHSTRLPDGALNCTYRLDFAYFLQIWCRQKPVSKASTFLLFDPKLGKPETTNNKHQITNKFQTHNIQFLTISKVID